MTTTIESQPQLTRDAFVALLRKLIDEGLGRDTIIEKMTPCRGLSVTEDFMTDALDAITSALSIAPSVSNARMQQAWADFIHSEKRALEEAGVYANRCAHIESAYPDPNIRKAKRAELDANKNHYRKMADQASVDWTAIQKQRIPLDRAAADFPQAFPGFTPWVPKPITE